MLMKLIEALQICLRSLLLEWCAHPCWYSHTKEYHLKPQREFLMTGGGGVRTQPCWMDDSRSLLWIYWKCFHFTSWKT
jgi:hypothetical protein